MTRSFRGLGRAPGLKSVEVVPGRAAVALWNGGAVPGGLVVASVYLECGVGMNDGNWQVVKSLATELRVMDRPFIIGGDFQQAPSELAEAGVMNLFEDAEVVWATGAGAEAAGTCCTKGRWSTIDYFIVSRALVQKVVCCEVELEAALRPHRPVKLTIRRGGPLPLQRVLGGPMAFPRSRPVGPARPPAVDWIRNDKVVKDTQSVEDLDKIVGDWFEAAEDCLVREFDVDPTSARKYVGRGGCARFKWIRPEIKAMKGRAKTSTRARAWYWLADRLGELVKLPAGTSGGKW